MLDTCGITSRYRFRYLSFPIQEYDIEVKAVLCCLK